MTGALSPALRDRLAKICARLSSEHDGERAAAALLASRLLAGQGLDWDDVLTCVVDMPPEPSGFAREMDERRRAWEARAPFSARTGDKPKAARKRRPAEGDPDEARRLGRLKEQIAFIEAHQHLLRPGQRKDFEWFSRAALEFPSGPAIQRLDYLESVIRRQVEEQG